VAPVTDGKKKKNIADQETLEIRVSLFNIIRRFINLWQNLVSSSTTVAIYPTHKAGPSISTAPGDKKFCSSPSIKDQLSQSFITSNNRKSEENRH
jgi:hypothetical protein